MENKLTTKALFSQENVQQKFRELLGKKAQGFITSVLQIAASNTMLVNADPMSVYNAAATAAALDLPLNSNLGFAYIIPFNDKKSGKVLAQFQIGYKGFIQLSQRSGKFQTISAAAIFEGQLIEENPLTGFVFDFTKKTSDTVIGYASYFKLLNGFEKTLYMTVDSLKKHATKFSQTYKKGYGLWVDDMDNMAIKTVIKLLLSKYAPLSIEMERAVMSDQAVINSEGEDDLTYIDNVIDMDKEAERIALMISDENSLEGLNKLRLQISIIDYPEQILAIDEKIEDIKTAKK